jgi:hypothetical protein
LRSIAQIRQILKEKKFQIIKFLWWVPVSSQKYRRIIIIFSSFRSSMKPNLTKASYGWLPLQLHHKIGKDKPWSSLGGGPGMQGPPLDKWMFHKTT